MPQALETLCLIQFWSWIIALFPILALWGNKNWPPSMKVKKLKKFGNKSGSMGCKWSSLNATGTGDPLSQTPTCPMSECPRPGGQATDTCMSNVRMSASRGLSTDTCISNACLYVHVQEGCPLRPACSMSECPHVRVQGGYPMTPACPMCPGEQM